ncbi:MAG TPA: acyl-CoA dehydrogenase, partial [Draconibacterium sp.]|nr:acyl-CoA dehydrogenase [Draconibacterium sp.]
MANYYTDNSELKFHLNHPLMKEIVRLKEREYAFKDEFDFAPLDYEDAIDSYDRVLDVVGEICGNIVAENAESIDAEGPEVIDG